MNSNRQNMNPGGRRRMKKAVVNGHYMIIKYTGLRICKAMKQN